MQKVRVFSWKPGYCAVIYQGRSDLDEEMDSCYKLEFGEGGTTPINKRRVALDTPENRELLRAEGTPLYKLMEEYMHALRESELRLEHIFSKQIADLNNKREQASNA